MEEKNKTAELLHMNVYLFTVIFIQFQSTSSQEDNVSEDSVELFHHLEPPDLSTWRVTIPRIGARPDPENPKKQFFVFIIDVRRVDVSNGNASGI